MKVIDLRSIASALVAVPLLCFIAIFLSASLASGQSTNISYPTPLYENEINGSIRARDIGDSRLTSYFYTFLGNQGDVFMNVVTKNFNGDIDVFLAEGLKPLTKVPIYADNGETETGRVIYLRKPEKLILRIEGRTPNDDPATFQIKFAGSFLASKDSMPEGVDEPKVETVAESNVRVNSVGTIIAVIPKARPTPKPPETVAEKTEEKNDSEKAAETRDEIAPPTADKEEAKPEVVVTENIPGAEKTDAGRSRNPRARRTTTRRNTTPVKRSEEAAERTDSSPAEVKNAPSRAGRTSRGANKPPSPSEPDPLANIHLVIEFKDGSRIERPMNEVLRFSVDKGILTVIAKDGTIGRYPILEVARTTIQ